MGAIYGNEFETNMNILTSLGLEARRSIRADREGAGLITA